MQAGPIRIVTLADDAYSMPLAVLVRSLIENYRCPRPLQITILDGGISPANRRRLDASWTTSTPQSCAEWAFVPAKFDDAESLPVWGRIPRLTYARLALPQYFDDDHGRLVLLDSDTLVLTDVARLHDVELDGAVVGATRDPYIPVVSALDGLATWREAGLAPDTPYFNAGVMVIDLERWRKEDVTRRTLDYIHRERKRLRQYDQDSLNAVLGSRWKELDERWQSHPRTFRSLGRRPAADPWIVHFSGRLKPWLYPAAERADQLFYEYLDRTDWRGFRPARNLQSWALQLYDSPVRRLVYPLEMRLLAWKRMLDKRLN